MKILRNLIILLAAILGCLFLWRVLPGHTVAHPGALDSSASVTVAASRAIRGDLERTITLTAVFRAYQEIDIHPKVAGFIKSIPVDIGDQVKQGGLLATLEIPELEEDLKKAQAGVDAANEAVNEANASYQGVHLDYTRLQQVGKEHPKLVAQQELDDLRAKDQAAAAGLANARQKVGQAQAEQKRESALVEYSRITAPFDGVVTKRYADVGAMIQAGTSSTAEATAIVRFAQENVIRAIFPVPESAVSVVKEGVAVKVTVSGLDRSIDGAVTRFARQLNPESRAMETEVDLPNDDLAITPGMYGWASLTLEQHKNALSVPLEALSVGENPTVYLVDRQNKIELRPVKLGMETADRVEVVEGLVEGDLVFIGNRAQVRPGAAVKVRLVEPEKLADR